MGVAKSRILVIDDDQAILDAVSLLLTEVGYEAVTLEAFSGADQIEAHKPDLILLDIWMSGIDGQEVCRELKSRPATKRIPILLFSANKDTEKIADSCGAEGAITKPFEMQTLLSAIELHVK